MDEHPKEKVLNAKNSKGRMVVFYILATSFKHTKH
jgi:hypothetical protein